MTPNAMLPPGNGLSTPRVNRLLRPLRNKCTALASESLSGPFMSNAHTTYSSNRVGWSSREPPLAFLQTPGNMGIGIYLDGDYTKVVELARRIYAIRDCFRNIVQVTFGVEVGELNPSRRDWQAIPSLGAMCAIVIGVTIQAEFNESVAAKTDDNDDCMDNEEVMELAYEIYEAVPPHYRRWATVSHALSMILSTCPHHPTLLAVLLDVCLSWNLVHESYVLLRALLVASMSPPTSTPPICHPAHSSYYLDLCTTWTGEGNKAAGDHSVRKQATFVRTLVDVLIETKLLDTWMCKAVSKLAREVRKMDFTSFVHIAVGLTDTIGNIERGQYTKKGKGKAHELMNTSGARNRLNKWVVTMLDHLATNMDILGSELLAPSTALSGELQAIAEFLGHAQLSNLHLTQTKSVTTQSKLPDSIICLAVCCLAFQPDKTVDLRDLVDLLSQTTPITSTFDKLVALQILEVEDWSNPQTNRQANIMRKLGKLAELLRSHSLLELEASLWACALRCLEQDSFSESKVHAGVEELKRRIIDAVDEAESRCFGSAPMESSASKPSQRRKDSDADKRTFGEEWEWEEMVRCWIRRSPVVKRPKVDVQRPMAYSQRVLRSTILQPPMDPPISASPTPSTSSSRIFSKSSGRATSSEHFTDESDADEEDYNDEDNYRISDVRPRPVAPRRVSNFASILADAQINRTVLHPHLTSAPLQPATEVYAIKGSRMPIDRKEITRDKDLVLSLDDSFSALPSDDSLDLFAYAQSSPITHR